MMGYQACKVLAYFDDACGVESVIAMVELPGCFGYLLSLWQFQQFAFIWLWWCIGCDRMSGYLNPTNDQFIIMLKVEAK